MLCDNPNLKFLVFAYHHSMMNGLCQSLYDKKVKFIRIDGDTPPSERPVCIIRVCIITSLESESIVKNDFNFSIMVFQNLIFWD